MHKINLRQIVNILAVIVTIIVNALANALPLNGQTTGEISDRFEVYFVPAGYVFSIWGLIYLALIAFAIYQALPGQRNDPRLKRIGYLFALSSLANIAWLFLWHYELFLFTVIAMLSLLGLLIAIYVRLEVGQSVASTNQKWFIHVPFSIYLGWVSVATIANITQVLDFVNWNGWGMPDEVWAVIMLIVGALITSAVYRTRNDGAFVLVIIWAYAGIAVKQSEAPSVALTAWIIVGLLGLWLIITGLFMRGRKQPSELAITKS
jgi:benzodiazapine receptor